MVLPHCDKLKANGHLKKEQAKYFMLQLLTSTEILPFLLWSQSYQWHLEFPAAPESMPLKQGFNTLGQDTATGLIY